MSTCRGPFPAAPAAPRRFLYPPSRSAGNRPRCTPATSFRRTGPPGTSEPPGRTCGSCPQYRARWLAVPSWGAVAAAPKSEVARRPLPTAASARATTRRCCADLGTRPSSGTAHRVFPAGMPPHSGLSADPPSWCPAWQTHGSPAASPARSNATCRSKPFHTRRRGRSCPSSGTSPDPDAPSSGRRCP